jgi:hypothetical protein
MRTRAKSFKPPGRLLLRFCLYGWWMGFLLVAAAFTLFFYAWQGFSPDGPPPGFKPEPIGWFCLKNFPVMVLALAAHYWWFVLPLLFLTVKEFRRIHAAESKPRHPSAYDLD